MTLNCMSCAHITLRRSNIAFRKKSRPCLGVGLKYMMCLRLATLVEGLFYAPICSPIACISVHKTMVPMHTPAIRAPNNCACPSLMAANVVAVLCGFQPFLYIQYSRCAPPVSAIIALGILIQSINL